MERSTMAFSRAHSFASRVLAGLLLAGILLGHALDTRAQVGEAAAIFLQIEPDSRAAAMGNANVAIADNANAVFWNPAGLAGQRGLEASITHSKWLPQFDAGLFYDYLVGKYHVEGLGTFGGHVTYFNLGEQKQMDEQGNLIGRFSAYELAAGASYGTQVSDRLAVGGGLRFIYSNLTGGTSVQVGSQSTHAGVSAGVDAAVLYKTAPFQLGDVASQVGLGANLANMGPASQYSDR
jgi:hypothetical protein